MLLYLGQVAMLAGDVAGSKTEIPRRIADRPADR
jgi:hypothetical protein